MKDLRKNAICSIIMKCLLVCSVVSGLMMVDEIGMAVQRIKKFSDNLGLNITKLATSGYSAGAHLSALYAYSRADERSD